MLNHLTQFGIPWVLANTEISKSQLHEASVGAQIKTKVANSYTYISNLCKSIFSDIL